MPALITALQHYPMNNPLFAGERTTLVAATQGRVLEICCETDNNLHYYSPWVTDLAILCVEGAAGPSQHRTNERGLKAEVIFSGSDTVALPFPDASCDWVVSTLTLCRAKNADAILADVRRVLKPAGGFLFLEHGRSADRVMANRQSRLRSLWWNIGGCDLDREIDRMIARAGLRIEKLDRYQLGQPKFLSTMYRGCARRD